MVNCIYWRVRLHEKKKKTLRQMERELFVRAAYTRPLKNLTTNVQWIYSFITYTHSLLTTSATSSSAPPPTLLAFEGVRCSSPPHPLPSPPRHQGPGGHAAVVLAGCLRPHVLRPHADATCVAVLLVLWNLCHIIFRILQDLWCFHLLFS